MTKSLETKKIKILTESTTLKGAKPVNGHLLRKWKVQLLYIPDNTSSDTSQIPFIDHVEFILHPTFENPRRVVTKAPFELQEKGWGEFDMTIKLHFVKHLADTFIIKHDLNFQRNRYETIHQVVLRDSRPESVEYSVESSPEYRASGKRKPLSTSSQVSSSRDVSKGSREKRQAKDTTRSHDRVKKESSRPGSADTEPEKEQSHGTKPPTPLSKRRKVAGKHYLTNGTVETSEKGISNGIHGATSRRLGTLDSERSSITDISAYSPPEVDLTALAEKLSTLKEEYVLDVMHMVKKGNTPGSYINEDVEGEFHFDLCTLNDDLVIELWGYVHRVSS